MYQTADNQLNEIIDLLTVIQSSWNGLLVYKIRSKFSATVLVLILRVMVLLLVFRSAVFVLEHTCLGLGLAEMVLFTSLSYC